MIEVIASITLALHFACRREPPLPANALDVPVAYHGCREIWLEPRPRCLVEPQGVLRLWIGRPDSTDVMVRVDGKPWPAKEREVDGMEGFGLEVALPLDAARLTVERVGRGPSWSLALRTWAEGVEPPAGVATKNDVDEALGRAYMAGEDGRHREALELLASIEATAMRYPKGQADLATYRGIAHWRQGRYHDAATALADGVTFAMRMHDPELIRDAIAPYAAILAELGYWDAAREWSDHVRTLAQTEPELFPCRERARIMSTLGYVHLLLARGRGERPLHARPLLEQALALVAPTGDCPDPASMPGVLLSLIDESLDRGDPQQALDTLATVDIDAAPTADQRLRLRDAELRALERMGRPWRELEQAWARLEDDVLAAALPEGRWRLALRRGDLLVHRGHFDAAIEAYERAELEAQQIAELAAVGVGRETAVTLHAQSTERMVALLAAMGRPAQALCAAREAQARRIQAVGGRGATDEQRNSLDRAIEGHQAAQRSLDQALARERVLPRKERNALHLQVALQERELAEAANEILRAQSTWRPSCEDLVPRRAGELLLGLYPMSRGWFVFVQDDTGTDVRWLDGGPTHALTDPALGSELLDPLTERLAAARRVRVLASGRAQHIDVHLLPWSGAALVEHVPVTYGAELPRLRSEPPLDSERIALLLADPTENLPRARTEIAAARWMTSQGWTLEVPTPDEADRTHVIESLARASFFYFAGHGEHDLREVRSRALPPYAGGTRDWPARLVLARSTRLEVQDILMLSSAPRHVALLGCETGVPEGGGGMSLALAFLVAGAEQVVATPVKVDDIVAHDIGVGLLETMSTRGLDLAVALQQAQAGMLRRGARVDRYRVWVR